MSLKGEARSLEGEGALPCNDAPENKNPAHLYIACRLCLI